jgi:MFS family permease
MKRKPWSPKPFGLSPNVFFMGVASFLTDVSSEMIFNVMPLFLFNVLGVGTAVIGLIEGVADSTATLFQVFSGWLSDRLRRRKALATVGYALSTVAKPFLYLAGTWGAVLAVRFTDRLGKGLRTPPRDALVADSTSPQEMGKSFGFHRALDTLGAVIGLSGAALVVFLMQRGALELTRDTFQMLVLIGIVPAVLAVAVIFRRVHDVKPVSPVGKAIPRRVQLRRFDAQFKRFLGVMLLFTLGNSSIAFLVLRAQNLGLSVLHILLLFVFFNFIYALVSLPAGMLSDRIGRRKVIVIGWSIFALSYLGFALASAWWQVWLFFALYGLYFGVTAGVMRAFVADMVGVERRGTAYGLFHTTVGITAFPASLIAGFMWQMISPRAPFFFGAVLAGVAAIALLVLVR